jgi:hypothetical protein
MYYFTKPSAKFSNISCSRLMWQGKMQLRRSSHAVANILRASETDIRSTRASAIAATSSASVLTSAMSRQTLKFNKPPLQLTELPLYYWSTPRTFVATTLRWRSMK